MSRRLDRRQFVQTIAAAIAGGYFVNPTRAAESKSANEKLNLAFVGVANKGGHNVDQLTSQNVAALCDVDSSYLDKQAARFPQARQYRDYRKLLDAERGKIDAVVVSTADHTHAPATSVALDLGLPVYCEKPLTHTVEEARTIAALAARRKVATQMGTQIHASTNYRRVVELVQAGTVGKINDVYTWCGKGWSNGQFEPTQPIPKNLDWDLWLGPAMTRAYSPHIHPSNWRRFWEYGSGTLGDMGCHVMDMPFWALGLRHPRTISATGPSADAVGCPAWCKVDYEFAATGTQPAVKLHWSDGGQHHDLVQQTLDHTGKPLSTWGLGALFVGERGMIAANYNSYQLLPQKDFADFKPPQPTIADSIGHWNEWIAACKTGSPTTCNFDYSGALTETVLLGTVAYRAGQGIEWDAAQLKCVNASNAEQYVRKTYRPGFEVVGIGRRIS